jgi:hypothetical protein
LTRPTARFDTRPVESAHDVEHAAAVNATRTEREAIGVPAGAAAALLELQGRIGNRAVGKLLRETDPRLTYTPQAAAEGAGLDAQTLPWKVPGDESAGWDALEILSKLTQVDESAATFTDQVRCGANSVLAVAITRGPLDTEAFARGVMLKALGRSKDAAEAGEKRTVMGKAYNDIWPAIRAVGNGTATYGDLSLIAHFAKVVMSKDPTGATTGHEVTAMAALLGGMQESGAPIEDRDQLTMFVNSLRRGQSFILLVGTNVLPAGVKSRSLSQVNHFVVLGKDRDGKPFLYDPYPRVGTQLFRWGDPGFWILFQNQQGDWKASYIFVRPKIE